MNWINRHKEGVINAVMIAITATVVVLGFFWNDIANGQTLATAPNMVLIEEGTCTYQMVAFSADRANRDLGDIYIREDLVEAAEAQCIAIQYYTGQPIYRSLMWQWSARMVNCMTSGACAIHSTPRGEPV